jgi:hypothetical protein
MNIGICLSLERIERRRKSLQGRRGWQGEILRKKKSSLGGTPKA